MQPIISFRDFEEADVPLLNKWLSMPHVSEYWQESENIEELKAKFPAGLQGRGIAPFIVLIDGQPAGYIQYYEADKIGGGWWPDMGSGTFGIDQFIGEPDMVGKGLGSLIIKTMCDYIFTHMKASAIIADPAPNNRRAIRAYEKSGFE
ncbi:MAG TPA: GNAT family N-acetyltransferase, partial [Alphaproteobacteria bacterium]